MSEIETNDKGEQVIVERSVVKKTVTLAELDAGLRVVNGKGGICTNQRQLVAALSEAFPGCKALERKKRAPKSETKSAPKTAGKK